MGTATGDVIMVEDDRDVAAMAKALYPSLTVVGELGALAQALEGKQPKLIVLDLELPDGHGFDALEELRRSARTKDVPIVVFTATDLPPTEGLERGANAWVRKPSDAEALETALRSIFDFWTGLNQPAVTRP